jgi:hypothetical protein
MTSAELSEWFAEDRIRAAERAETVKVAAMTPEERIAAALQEKAEAGLAQQTATRKRR